MKIVNRVKFYYIIAKSYRVRPLVSNQWFMFKRNDVVNAASEISVAVRCKLFWVYASIGTFWLN